MQSKLKTKIYLVDPYQKQCLERAYQVLLTETDLVEIDNVVHDFMMKKVEVAERHREEMKIAIRTSDHVIKRIQYYMEYAIVKASPKMRLSKRELDHALTYLDETEKLKVTEWINSNGGLQGVLAPEWTA